MNLKFIKCNLIFFEIVSFVMTLYIFGNLFYYSVIFANKSILNFPDDYSYMILPINFSVQYKNNIFNDFIITLYSSKFNNFSENNNNNTINKTNINNFNEEENDPNGYIIYNNYTFKDNDENEIISKINEKDPYNILIFENSTLAENFIDQIKNDSNTCDRFNLILYFMIIFFSFL